MSKAPSAKPAQVQDVDEDSGVPVRGTTKIANKDSKRAALGKVGNDTTSDSGYSSITHGTLASADSAKAFTDNDATPRPTPKPAPAAPDPPASAAATPTPTTTQSAAKSTRSESPTKKHRRSESKSSKRSTGAPSSAGPNGDHPPHAYYQPSYGPQPVPYYPYGYNLPGSAPSAHPAYQYPSGHYPPPADPAHHYTQPVPMPTRSSRSTRPRPASYFGGSLDYLREHPSQPAYATFEDLQYGHPASHESEHYLSQPAYQTRELLSSSVPSTRHAIVPTSRQRPPLVHANTDYRTLRRRSHFDPTTSSTYPDYLYAQDAPIFDDHAAAGSAYENARAPQHLGRTYRSSRTAVVDDDWQDDPVYDHGRRLSSSHHSRRPSTRHAYTEPSPVTIGSLSSSARLSTNMSNLPHDYLGPSASSPIDASSDRASHRHSVHHSRRSSKAPALADEPRARRYSHSPAFIVNESRSGRRSEYLSEEDRSRRSTRSSTIRAHDADLDKASSAAQAQNEAEKYMEKIRGGPLEDEIAKGIHRTYSHRSRQAAIDRAPPSVGSRQSGRSHRSHRQSMDGASTISSANMIFRFSDPKKGTYEMELPADITWQIFPKEEVKTGRTKDSERPSRDDRSGRATHDERERPSERRHSTTSSIRSLFSRAGSSRSRTSSDVGTEDKHRRRRSRVGSPIIEESYSDSREERRSHFR